MKDKEAQITALFDQCCDLPAEVRYKPENLTITVLVPPPWDAVAERQALSTQKRSRNGQSSTPMWYATALTASVHYCMCCKSTVNKGMREIYAYPKFFIKE